MGGMKFETAKIWGQFVGAADSGAIKRIIQQEDYISKIGILQNTLSGIEGTSAELRKERSQAMQVAAAGGKQKGVWKVGNKHIADMESDEKQRQGQSNERAYEITSREDFNRELAEYEKKNDAA